MPVNVKLTANLSKFYSQDNFTMKVDTLRDLLLKMDSVQPGISAKIVDDTGALKKYVNIFVNGKMVRRNDLDNKLPENSTIQIVQALAGG